MHGLQNAKLFKEKCFIDGKWISADSGNTIPVYNPFNNQQIGSIPACGEIETSRAIAAANTAWQNWREYSAKERGEILSRLALLIDANKNDLALLMTLEEGKPLNEALGEIDYANSFIKWFAEEGKRVYGDIIPSPKREQHLLVLKQPVGVTAIITPWNFPLAMITRKLGPALAAGCPVVIKPAEETPFSALALAVLAEEAGLPTGVLNVVTGIPEDIGKEMCQNPLVRKLSFTGSTAVGRKLMAQCAPTIKKLSLELGGNAPFIVFDDADIDAAVQGLMASKFRNMGQTCVCANRIYVQAAIYDIFAEKLKQAVLKLKLGNGLEKDITQGPLINQAGIEKIKKHVADAIDKGAQVFTGGKSATVGKLFFEPTILLNANATMLVAREETFGPVAALFKFDKEEEVIQAANNTEFGLASYFYSRTMQRIWRVSAALEYGIVGVNVGIISTEVAPFGGIKQSGIGREGSKYGIEDYLEIKYVCMN